MQCSKQHLYSITSSAPADMPSGTSRPSAVSGFGALENPAGVGAGLTIGVGKAGPVAH
jgi:hypothetical protein